MRLEILKKLSVLSKECVKAQQDAEKWNMKCMDLPPRVWIRWGKNTSIQAKASTYCQYRDKKVHELRIVMSEFIKDY